MYKENYHTHMRLCQHAEGNIEDYVLKAISLGFTHLGISDHGPIKNPGFPRMSLEEFKNEYITEFKYCKNKYKNIHLYLGLEMEYFYGMDNYYKELLKDCDYLILGNHYYSGYVNKNETSSYNCNTKEKLEEYVKLVEDALNTGFFKILAHPDFFLCGYPRWDKMVDDAVRRICLACIKNHVLLECNCNGFNKGKKDFIDFIDYMYPNYHFFQIVSEYKDLEVIVSSDAHKPIDLDSNLELGYKLLESLGIKPKLHPLDK